MIRLKEKILAIGIALLLSITAFAQFPVERKIGTSLDPDGIVRLDKFSGAVTIVIPLLKIESRGEVGFTLNETIVAPNDVNEEFFRNHSSMVGPGVMVGSRMRVMKRRDIRRRERNVETLMKMSSMG